MKQKDKAGRPDIDAFETAMRRAGCEKGFFVSFDYSGEAETEISRFFREEHRVIVPISVREILDDQIAHKLPTDINPDKDVASMYSSAYVAVRKHNYSVAADLLRKCRNRLPADLNYYLVQDLAFREYARQPEIAEFFQ